MTMIKYKTTFTFYFFILVKLSDYFAQFMNSNINFLISNELHQYVENEVLNFINQYFNFVLSTTITPELKHIQINKNLSPKLVDNKLKEMIIEYLDRDIFTNNKIFERAVAKFSIYVYFTITISLLMYTNIDCVDESKFRYLISSFDRVSNLQKSLIIKELNDYILTLLHMNETQSLSDFKDLIEFQNNSKSTLVGLEEDESVKVVVSLFKSGFISKLKVALLVIRKLYYLQGNSQLLAFLKQINLDIDTLPSLMAIKIMTTLSINCSELFVIDSSANTINKLFEFIKDL